MDYFLGTAETVVEVESVNPDLVEHELFSEENLI